MHRVGDLVGCRPVGDRVGVSVRIVGSNVGPSLIGSEVGDLDARDGVAVGERVAGLKDGSGEDTVVGILVGPPLIHCRVYPLPMKKNPELQMHADDPLLVDAELRGQERQLDEPAKEKVPEGHIEHTKAPFDEP